MVGDAGAVLHPIGGKWVKTEREACPSLEMIRTHHPARRTSDVIPEYHGVCPSPRQVERACRKRSEEHTSELQSHLNLLSRLLLQKKKSTSNSHQFRQPPH